MLRSWGGRIFRFNLRNFRLNEGLSLRRFSIVEAAILIIVAMLASRGLGVIRQTLFNALFGTGPDANAYFAAERLPDTLFNLVAGGALSHAFIPVFLAYQKRSGESEAWRLTSLVFNVVLVAVTLITIIGEYIAPTFVSHILVPGYPPAEQARTTDLTRVLLFQPLILGLGSVVTGVLNSRRQFLLPALSIAIYNVGLIAGLLLSLAIPSIGIYGPTYGELIAAVLQVGVQVPGLWKQGVRYSFCWDMRHPGLHEVLHLLGPNILTVAIVYVGFTFDISFTSYLPDPASLAALHNAYMLQGLPIALISSAIGQSLLPHLTAYAEAGRYVRMRLTALKVMSTSVLLTIPAAVLLAILGKPIIQLVFQHGAFDTHSTDLTSLALLGYALSIPSIAMGDQVSRAFYALKDARTPLCTSIFSVAVRVGLILFLLRILPKPSIILSIPLALAGSTTAEAVLLSSLLLFRLNKRVRNDKGMLRLLQRRQKLNKKLLVMSPER